MTNKTFTFLCLVSLLASGCGSSIDSDSHTSHEAGLNASSRLAKALKVFQGYYGEDGHGRIGTVDIWATLDLRGDDLKVTAGYRPLGTQGTIVNSVQDWTFVDYPDMAGFQRLRGIIEAPDDVANNLIVECYNTIHDGELCQTIEVKVKGMYYSAKRRMFPCHAIASAEALRNPQDSANKYFQQVIEHYSDCCDSFKAYEVEREQAEEDARADGKALVYRDFDCELAPFYYDVYGTRDSDSDKAKSTSTTPTSLEETDELSTAQPETMLMAIQDPDGWSNIRKEPKGEILRRANNGETAEIVGKSDDGRWIELKFSDGIQGFVHSSRLVEASIAD